MLIINQNKGSLLSMLLSFSVGVVITAGTFMYLAIPLAEHPMVEKKVLIKQQHDDTASEQPAKYITSVAANSTGAQVAVDIKTQQQYAEQIAALSAELALTNKQLKLVKQELALAQLNDADFALQLEAKFNAESENPQWHYEVETALTDFLITSDLTNPAQLSDLVCKQTLCKFTLVADKHFAQAVVPWRELNDKLSLMPWWQQFKLTSSSSTEARIEFLVSTKE